MSDYVEVNLATILGGAAGERFQDALKEVLDNCVDLNTDQKQAREIILKFKFSPDAMDRGKIACLLNCKTKLAPPHNVVSFMYAGNQDGELKAFEQDIKQDPLPFAEEEKAKPKIVKMEVKND